MTKDNLEELKTKYLTQLTEIALLANNATFDTIEELISIRNVEIKFAYLRVMNKYLDIQDRLHKEFDCSNEYANIYLVFEWGDLRNNCDKRYINQKFKVIPSSIIKPLEPENKEIYLPKTYKQIKLVTNKIRRRKVDTSTPPLF